MPHRWRIVHRFGGDGDRAAFTVHRCPRCGLVVRCIAGILSEPDPPIDPPCSMGEMPGYARLPR